MLSLLPTSFRGLAAMQDELCHILRILCVDMLPQTGVHEHSDVRVQASVLCSTTDGTQTGQQPAA